MSRNRPQELQLPWSDGDSKFWPSAATGSKSGERYASTDLDDDASVQWRRKIGANLANHLQLPGDGAAHILGDWPNGYMLFIHHKGDRQDKYLYGRKDVRYRSAAEFAPHAQWLWEKANEAATDPPPPCKCRHCAHDKGPVRGKELLPQKPMARKLVQPRAALPNKRLPTKVSENSHLRSSKDTARRPPHHPQPQSAANNQAILALIRVSTATTAPATGVNVHFATAWPILHELVWCKLQRPMALAGVVIDMWPGIIKEDNDGSDQYLVTLIGVTNNELVSMDAMVPYRAHRTAETLISGIRQLCRGQTRIKFLNLDRYLGRELDKNRSTVVSSAFLFATAFSEHLATVWSWKLKSNVVDPSSVRPAPSRSRYPLRLRKTTTEYDALWWGPECIEKRQLVQLKMSRDVISDPSPTTDHSAGLEESVFLQIHSISCLPKSRRAGESIAGPVIAGMVFELTDGHQCDHSGSSDLPPPPCGKAFRPLLKEGYEIVLPVTVLGGRYYGSSRGPENDLVLDIQAGSLDPIAPTTFYSTRAKMAEHAYTAGRQQALQLMVRGDNP